VGGAARGGAAVALGVTTVSVVVVTYDSAAWIERCLASVAEHERIVVDNGSSDGTVALVRERFPDVRVLEGPNVGFGAGMNAGMRVASGRYFLVLNADAWAVGDAVERLVAFAEAHPRAAVVGPRLRFPDGRLQRSARAFPTPWRLATEYLFLRKLGPRTRVFNAFYEGPFEHDRAREVDWLFGPCLLVRRAATDEVGLFDEDYFMFSEEVDWCWRFRRAGWQVWFTPDAEFVHVGGAAHGGALHVEYLRGHLRFLAKHRGRAEAERARQLFLAAYALRAAAFRGDRGRRAREALQWLRSAPSVPALLDAPRP
jgi:GT2 family glycosyltransferase